MTLDRFLMYRNESLCKIIQDYNKDDSGGNLDPVLKTVIVTLNQDLVNFRNLFTGLTPADKATPATSVYLNSDKFKKQYEEAKSENTNKAKRITSIEKQIARFESRSSANGGPYRPNPNRGVSKRGGFNRGGNP
jgi:hypothetical protein